MREVRLTAEQWAELQRMRDEGPEATEARWRREAHAKVAACAHESRSISSWEGTTCSDCGARLVGEVWAAGFDQLVMTEAANVRVLAPSERKVIRPKAQDQTARVEHLEAQLRRVLDAADALAKRVEKSREVLG